LATPSKYRVVDLFCGCGGLSRGLERTDRFRTILGVDIDEAALNTFASNHGSVRKRPSTWLGDIRDLSLGHVWTLLGKHGITTRSELDCLVGGPPCEGFSRNKVYTNGGGADDAADPRASQPKEYREEKYWQTAWQAPSEAAKPGTERRTVQAYNPFLDDPRNKLFRWFLELAEGLRPKLVLIENVRQILSHQNGIIASEIIERLETMGYVATSRVLNAAQFGVPQLRHRVFFVAVRKDLMSAHQDFAWPEATHRDSKEPDLFSVQEGLEGDNGLFVTVREAIGDLPPAKPERSVSGIERAALSAYPEAPLSTFRRFVRSRVAAPANHIYRTPSEQVMARVRAMRPGMKPHHLPKDLQTKKYYYNAYGRLEWDRPANTITKSFLYPGSGKFGHPGSDRIISYREAARLQSFDDDFTFHASSQESLADMIGSAVPPLLGLRFGQKFAQFLDQALTRASGRHQRSTLPKRARRAR
jgi:DNA (cytosine-5)-methyltransferase 1